MSEQTFCEEIHCLDTTKDEISVGSTWQDEARKTKKIVKWSRYETYLQTTNENGYAFVGNGFDRKPWQMQSLAVVSYVEYLV